MARCYDNLSREDLIELLKKQDKELALKKYGLVWDSEKEPEKVVLDCENNLPILQRVFDKEIKTDDSDCNILIEGDNFHALSVLNYTHKGKIDVIYIDPPYNTGNKDFKYNDTYVDKEDGYRHSKWLNFMEKRLNLAKELLSLDGIIVISINDIEHSNLKILLDKIFGEKNYIADLPTIMNLKGNQDNFGFADTHEYTLLYAKNKEECKINLFEIDEDELDDWEEDEFGLYKKADTLRRTGQDAPRERRPKGWFPVFIDEEKQQVYVTENDQPRKKSDILIFPINESGVEVSWSWGKTKIMQENHNLILTKSKTGKYNIYKKQRPQIGDLPTKKPKTLFYKPEYSSSTSTNELKKMFGRKVFNNPKPVPLIKDLIYLTTKNNAIILDFMAGSGTTAHALLSLNNEDRGNRRFILCTNNENQICTEVCYPRIEKVINGYNKNGNGEFIKGLGGNLQYFKTDFIKNSENIEQLKINLTYKCTEMLCLKENIYNLKEEQEDYKIFVSNKKDKYLCVYYNFLNESFEQFLKTLKEIKEEKIIYIFSLENSFNKEFLEEVDNYKLETIPQKILDVYKKIIKENIRG
ncbi:MAG: site-specific DNA-methyltransferase [Cyanobacteria bacterium SIG28]|nr:site-specific DNA-methyltransferase [Cyanobacteria bacterium SIG28]